jgi:hypothetical protein
VTVKAPLLQTTRALVQFKLQVGVLDEALTVTPEVLTLETNGCAGVFIFCAVASVRSGCQVFAGRPNHRVRYPPQMKLNPSPRTLAAPNPRLLLRFQSTAGQRSNRRLLPQ